MELRDSFETVASRASEGAEAATASVSDGVDVAREAASTGASAARDAATSNATAARETAVAARRRAAAGVPAAFDRVPSASDRLVAVVRSASVPGRLPTGAVEPAVREYGPRALALAGTVDLGTAYRYGKAGFEYGGSYGRYVPFGNALPYVGLLAGLGAGVLDGADVVKVETLLDLTRHAPEALAERFDVEVPSAGESGLVAAVSEGGSVTDGPVGVTTDSPASVGDETTAEAYAAMEYDEFAGR